MNTPINDGGPAFPVPDVECANGQIQYGSSGMTLRAWLAGKAMAGILSQSPSGFFAPKRSLWEACWNKAKEEGGDIKEMGEVLAATSCMFADALIAELEKRKQPYGEQH
jgi:hypothetical protein